ncbi:MAG: alternative ribosome rescue aminoacyl-tRNA hydrolase ArfB [Desulfobacterales bacterium]|nr:alternative ribosome rescue aminoacyl-tRNA hydrolase ArfB [Desulfobacterales bacterium]
MIKVTPNITISEDEIQIQFMRASGPGGQHVNKTSTAVQLRFDIKNSLSLPDVIRERLLQLPDRRITADGVLVITARRFRSQDQNRQDAVQRLVDLVSKSAQKPRRRRKTKPSRASIKRRLEHKRRQGTKKGMRRRVTKTDDSL